MSATSPLLALVLAVLASVAALAAESHAQGHAGHGSPAAAPASAPAVPSAPAPPFRATMEELHRTGGVPRGWSFRLPPGDAARGRQVYADLECYRCHAIHGESFPGAPTDVKTAGPDLTGMGSHHPAEYLAESVVNPNAVIVEGAGFTGANGLSIMPSFGDSLTVPQLLDLVAYLQSLRDAGHDHERGQAEREQVAGPYRVRLAYEATGAGHASEHAGHGGARPRHGRLAVSVADRLTGAPVPYLPVSATIESRGKAPARVTLSPVIGDGGLQYVAEVALPSGTRKITLSIGAIAARVQTRSPGFGKPATTAFAWESAAR